MSSPVPKFVLTHHWALASWQLGSTLKQPNSGGPSAEILQHNDLQGESSVRDY